MAFSITMSAIPTISVFDQQDAGQDDFFSSLSVSALNTPFATTTILPPTQPLPIGQTNNQVPISDDGASFFHQLTSNQPNPPVPTTTTLASPEMPIASHENHYSPDILNGGSPTTLTTADTHPTPAEMSPLTNSIQTDSEIPTDSTHPTDTNYNQSPVIPSLATDTEPSIKEEESTFSSIIENNNNNNNGTGDNDPNSTSTSPSIGSPSSFTKSGQEKVKDPRMVSSTSSLPIVVPLQQQQPPLSISAIPTTTTETASTSATATPTTSLHNTPNNSTPNSPRVSESLRNNLLDMKVIVILITIPSLFSFLMISYQTISHKKTPSMVVASAEASIPFGDDPVSITFLEYIIYLYMNGFLF